MLVLLGPSFDGSNEGFARLAEATGLVAYDLRSRIKPGWWGVIRALGDVEQAEQLALRLRKDGFPVVTVELGVAWSSERRFVKVQGLTFTDAELVLEVRDRKMSVPYAAVLAIVRGEVGGLRAPVSVRATKSSASFRAVIPSAADLDARDAGRGEAYQVADVHFHTVTWVGRLDARSFDFSQVAGATGHPLRDLDLLIEELSRRSGCRVDRGARMSSLAPYALQGQRRGNTPVPGRPQDPDPDPFDGYSRLVAEAELEAFRHRAD